MSDASSTPPRVVRPGDTVASIALENGGADPASVWNHPKNQSLRELRGDPSILLPGDVLYVPTRAGTPRSLTSGTTNSFTAKPPTHTVRLVLKSEAQPATEPYVITGLGEELPGNTAQDGSLSVEVPVTCKSFVLQLPARGTSHKVLVGHLDPHTEPTGVHQRLSNLGYSSVLAPLLATLGVDASSLERLPLQAFQRAKGLTPTGDVDAATIDALKAAHGT